MAEAKKTAVLTKEHLTILFDKDLFVPHYVQRRNNWAPGNAQAFQ
jgi:hypothetical protein